MAEKFPAGESSVQAGDISQKPQEVGSRNLLTLLKGVIKRDGSLVPFDSEKIRYAIQRAGSATREYDADEAYLLTAQVVKVLVHKFRTEPPKTPINQ